MQEEGALSNKFPVVELATPPKGAMEELDTKPTANEMVDSPHASPQTSGKSSDKDDVNVEAVPSTTSNISVDSTTVAEVLVSIQFIENIGEGEQGTLTNLINDHKFAKF